MECGIGAQVLSSQVPFERWAKLWIAVGCTLTRVALDRPRSLVESSRGKNPAVEKAIEAQLDKCIKETNLSAGKKKVVRVGFLHRCSFETVQAAVRITPELQ